ncbi:Multidrug resistance-associated protein 1, partial [Coemansia sp. RSA 2399]
MDSTIIPAHESLEAIEEEASIDENKVEDVIADGQHLIRIFNVEKHFTSRYAEEKDRAQRIHTPMSLFIDISVTVVDFLSGISHVLCRVVLLLLSQVFGKAMSSAEFVVFTELTEDLVDNASSIMELPGVLLSFKSKISTFRGYTDLEREELCVDGAEVPEQDWPHLGKIEFSNFSMKYRQDLEYALKDINITIHPGEKVGIVGRTGAGKTSLARC